MSTANQFTITRTVMIELQTYHQAKWGIMRRSRKKTVSRERMRSSPTVSRIGCGSAWGIAGGSVPGDAPSGGCGSSGGCVSLTVAGS